MTASRLTVELPDLAATEAFGRRLGGLLFPGAVVGLAGQLGAGKTHLARAIVEGLGADPRRVNSPTFVIIQEYEGRHPIAHFDVYRLGSVREFADLGVEDYFRGGYVSLIEWADRVAAVLPDGRLDVTIGVTGPASRRLDIVARGESYYRLVNEL